MEQMRELVDATAFEHMLMALAVAGPILGILSGLIVGTRAGAPRAGVLKGLAIGALGPILFGMWRLYNHFVRFDPATESFQSFPSPRPGARVRQILGRPGEVWAPESGTDTIVVLRTE